MSLFFCSSGAQPVRTLLNYAFRFFSVHTGRWCCWRESGNFTFVCSYRFGKGQLWYRNNLPPIMVSRSGQSGSVYFTTANLIILSHSSSLSMNMFLRPVSMIFSFFRRVSSTDTFMFVCSQTSRLLFLLLRPHQTHQQWLSKLCHVSAHFRSFDERKLIPWVLL